MTSYVIHALVPKRAELSGDIEHTHRPKAHDPRARALGQNQFDPDYQVDAIKPKSFRPPDNWSKRGQMTRLILGILRQANEPTTTGDVTLQLLFERGLDLEDVKMFRVMRGRVATALRGQRDKGIVKSVEGPGQYMLWELCRT